MQVTKNALFTLKPSKRNNFPKSLIYGGFGLSSFMTLFMLRRMLQVRYYKQLEAHEQKVKAQHRKILAVAAAFVLLAIIIYTDLGNEMAANLIAPVHH